VIGLKGRSGGVDVRFNADAWRMRYKDIQTVVILVVQEPAKIGK